MCFLMTWLKYSWVYLYLCFESMFPQFELGDSLLYVNSRFFVLLQLPDQVTLPTEYHNDPKFSDRQVWANSVDPEQTAPKEAVYPGSTLFAIPSALFGHISLYITKLHCSNFRIITAIFSVCEISGVVAVTILMITKIVTATEYYR